MRSHSDGERPHLAGLLDEPDACVHEEADRPEHRREPVVGDLPRLPHRVQHADRGGQRVRDLLHRRRPCLLEVVAAHVDRVPQRDPLRAERDHVDDQPPARHGREDVRAPAQVLLDDVVLGRPPQLRGLDALPFGVGDVEPEQPRRGGVDRHRRVHLARRDPVEELLHVPEVGDGDADLADLAPRQRIVGVVAGLRGQIERDGQPGLALGEVRPVQAVRRLGRRMARVRPHQPRSVAGITRHGGSFAWWRS